MIMLNVTATNFGTAPEQIKLSEFVSGNMLFLVGEVHIDATTEEYKAARYLTLTVPDLPFDNSRISAAFALAEIDGAMRISLTTIRIKDGSTIRIDKVPAYEASSPYMVFLSSVLFPANCAFETEPQQAVSVALDCTQGGLTDAECFMVDGEGWAMLVLNAASLEWEDEKVVVRLKSAEELSAEFVPVIYADNVNDALGSKMYPGALNNGVLTIERAGATDEPEGSTHKFFRVFIIK